MIQISKPYISDEEKKLVEEVLNSGNLAQGKFVKQLEENFSSFCGAKYCVALNSGTAALHAAMYGLKISKGDEVITTPFTFVASANSIIMQGATPIFADIDEETFNINPEEIESKITNKTKAIEPVDLYGQLCDYNSIFKIAKKYNLKVIEDACQSINAEYNGKKAGNISDATAFSLYATKNIMCGEGGILTTNDEEVYERAKLLRHHGQSEKTRYEYFDLGYNYRMTDISAAIAIPQLKRADEITKRRRENAKFYFDELSKFDFITLPKVKNIKQHVFHQFTIRINSNLRQKFVDYMKSKEIICGVYYPKPLHLHPFFKKLGYKEGDFKIAEKISKEVVSLPVHPQLKEEDLYYIIKTISGFDAKN